MQTKSYKTVQFILDENERNTIKDALEIMRKVRDKFLTSDMPKHQNQIEEFRKLMWDVLSEKEISE